MFKSKMVVLLGLLAVSGAASADLSKGLVAYYPFDADAQDKTANQNNGTENGSLQYVGGVINQGVSLDGAGSYIEIPSASQINFDTNQDFSVTVFVQASPEQSDTTFASNAIVEKWSDSAGYPFVIRYHNQTTADNGRVPVGRYDGSHNPVIFPTAKINNNRFNHITFVKKGTTLLFYLNGKLVGKTTDTTTGTTANNSPLYIGRRGGANSMYFKGVVDDLRIYNRAISASEIIELYNLALPISGTVKSLAAHTVSCTNETTGQVVSIASSKATAYDCEAKGLKVNVGENISILIKGKSQ